MANSYSDYVRITGTASAPSGGPIDNFEDGGVSEYSGDTGNVNVQTSTVYDGTYALSIPNSNSIESTSGLDRYPKPGDEIVFYLNPTSGGSNTDASNFYFADDGSGPISTGYRAITDPSANRMSLVTDVPHRIKGGNHLNGWERVKITWGDNYDVVVEVFDPADDSLLWTVAGSGSDIGSGGIAWRTTHGSATSYFDNAFVNSTGNSVTLTEYPGHWFKLNEGSGSTVSSSTSSLSGSITGASWTTDSKTGGQSLDLDGSDDLVDFGKQLNWDQASFSVSAWVKPDASSLGQIFGNGASSDSDAGWALRTTDNGSSSECNLQWVIGDGSTRTPIGHVVSLDTWHHVVCVRDISVPEIRLYVDGVLEASASTAGNSLNTGTNYHIGPHPAQNGYYDGTVDDNRVYTFAFDGTQAATIYNNTK